MTSQLFKPLTVELKWFFHAINERFDYKEKISKIAKFSELDGSESDVSHLHNVFELDACRIYIRITIKSASFLNIVINERFASHAKLLLAVK